MFLVVIDAHSKWIEVSPMVTATSLTTIQQLRQMFSRFGLPDIIVLDNGPQFASSEFAKTARILAFEWDSPYFGGSISSCVKWLS